MQQEEPTVPTIDVNYTKMYYERTGQGPTILFVRRRSADCGADRLSIVGSSSAGRYVAVEVAVRFAVSDALHPGGPRSCCSELRRCSGLPRRGRRSRCDG